MCGIVGAIAERHIEQILIEGLKRLEYRGYDSAGMAVLHPSTNEIIRKRVHGKVAALEKVLHGEPLTGNTGIAHTRWATHGKPNELNAHPHTSGNDIAIVHNGIIENHVQLREQLKAQNYIFTSETDSEVVAHLVHYHFTKTHDMMTAILAATQQMQGAFAICILSKNDPNTLYAIRSGSPLVIGLGNDESFIASDPLALLSVTHKFIYLEEGDVAAITRTGVHIKNAAGETITREIRTSSATQDAASKGHFPHYMLKEIYDQPAAISDTLKYGLTTHDTLADLFGPRTNNLLATISHIKIIACGTSYHAGLIARFWIESIARIPASVEIASEYRYRDSMMEKDTLFVAISQSGETADTLAATRYTKQMGCKLILAICNAAESTLAREADLLLLTRSGKEVGVAATKTFTTQLIALALLTLAAAKQQGADARILSDHIAALNSLPGIITDLLHLDEDIKIIAQHFADKQHALFIARGELYPIAAEGALKLKEISYVHAESYPAGELKHGPLALIDEQMPVIVLAPHNALFEKLQSNIQEVRARGGDVLVISDQPSTDFDDHTTLLKMPTVSDFIAPIAYTIPMQLLAYHIAVLKGTDVDQPRNLAKSVTVE